MSDSHAPFFMGINSRKGKQQQGLEKAGSMWNAICFLPASNLSALCCVQQHQHDSLRSHGPAAICSVLPAMLVMVSWNGCRSRIKRGFVHTVLERQGQRHEPDGARIVAAMDRDRDRKGQTVAQYVRALEDAQAQHREVQHKPRRSKEEVAAERAEQAAARAAR